MGFRGFAICTKKGGFNGGRVLLFKTDDDEGECERWVQALELAVASAVQEKKGTRFQRLQVCAQSNHPFYLIDSSNAGRDKDNHRLHGVSTILRSAHWCELCNVHRRRANSGRAGHPSSHHHLSPRCVLHVGEPAEPLRSFFRRPRAPRLALVRCLQQSSPSTCWGTGSFPSLPVVGPSSTSSSSPVAHPFTLAVIAGAHSALKRRIRPRG